MPFVYLLSLLYCAVLITKIAPKKVSIAESAPTISSPKGKPQMPASAK